MFQPKFGMTTDHQWTDRRIRRPRAKFVEAQVSAHLTRRLELDVLSQDVFGIYLILHKCFRCSLLQSAVLFLGSPPVLEQDLGPNLDITDVNGQMWITIGRTEVENSGHESCFCSGT